jgi:hypothetical protein
MWVYRRNRQDVDFRLVIDTERMPRKMLRSEAKNRQIQEATSIESRRKNREKVRRRVMNLSKIKAESSR